MSVLTLPLSKSVVKISTLYNFFCVVHLNYKQRTGINQCVLIYGLIQLSTDVCYHLLVRELMI